MVLHACKLLPYKASYRKLYARDVADQTPA
jgi:hypothetical protein